MTGTLCAREAGDKSSIPKQEENYIERALSR